jgi:hypothetical protein
MRHVHLRVSDDAVETTVEHEHQGDHIQPHVHPGQGLSWTLNWAEQAAALTVTCQSEQLVDEAESYLHEVKENGL